MGIFHFFKEKLSQSKNPIDEIQKEFIEKSINTSERLISSFNEDVGYGLDYSEASLKILDENILSLFYDNKDHVSPDMKEDIIAQAGSYIFEVVRRYYGGKYYWHDKLNQPILIVNNSNSQIKVLAFEEVKKRIEYGNEYNIPSFFKTYSNVLKKENKVMFDLKNEIIA
ncbi:hypothetical protein [Flavivirga algicola]|uniref:Uncharacterized protein n=1 Tax=Flavivirga algicola TaxID=2729136 RepID=A0ABX1RXJ5_9FLAO|nr:hypothetical protein [Flavivirga algicola]NMH87758.1 hypothetical protein [Flavivirga algicola]